MMGAGVGVPLLVQNSPVPVVPTVSYSMWWHSATGSEETKQVEPGGDGWIMNGQAVDRWIDQEPTTPKEFTIHGVAETHDSPHWYRDVVNSLPVVFFSEEEETASMVSETDWFTAQVDNLVIFIVLSRESVGPNGGWFFCYDGATNKRNQFSIALPGGQGGGGSTTWGHAWFRTGDAVPVGREWAVLDEFNVYTAVLTASARELYFNGVLLGSDALTEPITLVNERVFLSDNTAGLGFPNFRAAEMIVVEGTMSGAARATEEARLIAKYGIAVPANPQELRAHFDAALGVLDEVGGAPSEGSQVEDWADQSAYGNDLNAVTANRPTYRATAINGLPAIEWDTTTDRSLKSQEWMSLPRDAAVWEHTLFMVAKFPSTNTGSIIFRPAGQGQWRYEIGTWITPLLAMAMTQDNRGRIEWSGTPWSASTWYCYTFLNWNPYFDPTGTPRRAIIRNGVALVDEADAFFYDGLGIPGPLEHLVGQASGATIAEIKCYRGPMDETQRASIETDLMTKYGL